VSTLKAELDVCLAELETERQMHQKEEKALRARVVEVEKQRDATVLQVLFVSFYILIFFSADLFFLPGLAL